MPIASLETYMRRNDEMRWLVLKQSMIEFQASDGWEPLCKFLGCDIPATPLPRLNDKNVLRAALWKSGTAGIVLWILLLLFLFFLYKLCLCRPGQRLSRSVETLRIKHKCGGLD